MTKRRLEEEGFANVLRQKPKEDPVLKQQVAQNTFARLMSAQQPQATRKLDEPSYKYFNNNNQEVSTPIESNCRRCMCSAICAKCTFCEFDMCQNCLQQCSLCQYIYCGGCSLLDYSQSSDQIFCLSCKQN